MRTGIKLILIAVAFFALLGVAAMVGAEPTARPTATPEPRFGITLNNAWNIRDTRWQRWRGCIGTVGENHYLRFKSAY